MLVTFSCLLGYQVLEKLPVIVHIHHFYDGIQFSMKTWHIVEFPISVNILEYGGQARHMGTLQTTPTTTFKSSPPSGIS